MLERLQKIIAHAGVASRRKAEQLILEGRVTVNGRRVQELGFKADPRTDHVKVDGKLIRPEPLEYYAVHKPAGMLSSVSDPQGRPVVRQLVRSRARLYPAGRLDFNSEGLMILSNDGALTRRLIQAGEVDKVYRVKVRGMVGKEELEKLRQGIRLGGAFLSVRRVTLLKKGNNCWYEVVLAQGKNRQIRRLFEHVGHPVMRLRRTAIGPVELKKLKPGEYRELTASEVARLMTWRTSSPAAWK